MSFIVYFFILHLYASMHACNSRPLGVFDNESGRELLTSKVEEIMIAKFGGGKALESLANANNMKQKGSNANLGVENMDKGIDTKVQVSQEETKTEGWKRQARSTIECKQQDTKEAVNSKEDKLVEDVVVMDYAQPHRKPPIHNLKP